MINVFAVFFLALVMLYVIVTILVAGLVVCFLLGRWMLRSLR